MANAMDKALARIAQNKEFQRAQEALKNNNVTIAANDNSQVRLAAQNNQGGAKTVEQALQQANPEAREKMQQTMSEAKENIPGDTMKDVKENTPPEPTPSQKRPTPVGLENKQVDIEVQSRIETVEQGKGNNYRNENAMDRFLAKQNKEPKEQAPAQEKAKTR